MKEADAYSLRGETVRKAIEADVQAGLVPFFVSRSIPICMCTSLTVVASVGTTSTGAVDSIAEIGEACTLIGSLGELAEPQ